MVSIYILAIFIVYNLVNLLASKLAPCGLDILRTKKQHEHKFCKKKLHIIFSSALIRFKF